MGASWRQMRLPVLWTPRVERLRVELRLPHCRVHSPRVHRDRVPDGGVYEERDGTMMLRWGQPLRLPHRHRRFRPYASAISPECAFE